MAPSEQTLPTNADENGFPNSSISTNRTTNEVHFIQHRRLDFYPNTRKNLELLCEDKSSKYKLEEVHFSLPSSIKSTFIMTFSPDGCKVASTHGDHCIYICDFNTGKLLSTLEGHPKTPWCLAWHPCNKEILASGCLAGEVRVWDLQSKACECWTSRNNTIITSLDFHPKERILVIATANDVHFWDWSESEPFAKTTTTHDKEKVKYVEFDSSGTKLITGISYLPYSIDSLQNRIIDSCMNQAPLDMTQNSEINSPISNTLNAIGILNERNPSSNRLSTPTSTESESDISYRSSSTLARIATLYRNLEHMEDSMRHTTFSPYVASRIASGSSEAAAHSSNQQDLNSHQLQSDHAVGETGETSTIVENQSHQSSDATDNNSQEHLTTRASDPFVHSFDESLEQLQLRPLILDGQEVNLTTVIEQYPIDLPNQWNFVMQYNDINQVNQNFIRISKLMSSVKLYRQVVQQIKSSNHGQGHYQPNQILTAQSFSPRSSRQATNLPLLFRNFSSEGIPIGVGRIGGTARPTDPIFAIQFRNSARNVPLVTICRMDLLCARTAFIARSQQLLEQAMSERPSQSTSEITSGASNLVDRSSRWNSIKNSPPFHHLLNELHNCLTNINHAPLTTSNVHTHISLLRNIINSLLNTMSAMFQNQDESNRITQLVHNIAHSLTGRSWNIPLGATLDDIRLDVIHTMCIVDLTLHLTRQVQLLQLQRLSAVARIEVSRRNSNNRSGTSSSVSGTDSAIDTSQQLQDDVNRPSTSGMVRSTQNSKRRDLDECKAREDATKRRKLQLDSLSRSSQLELPSATEQPSSVSRSSTDTKTTNDQSVSSVTQNSSTSHTSTTPLDSLAPDSVELWNSRLEQTYQRFLAHRSSTSNNGFSVHIYIAGNPSQIHPTQAAEPPTDRSNSQPVDLRRRALSQDNSGASVSQEAGTTSSNVDQHRNRQMNAPSTSSLGPTGVLTFDAWIQSQLQLHQATIDAHPRGHLWFNQWTIPMSNCNHRVQCWNFSLEALPNIRDPNPKNIITRKCRIHNDASIDISSDGGLIACLVPQDDGGYLPIFDLKVFSLKEHDLGVCYHQLPHGPNAISVSLSPSGRYAVVGLASNKFISSDPSEDHLTIAKVFKLNRKHPGGYVRDIKIKRDHSSLSLNAIRWMTRGIVYNVGPQHHQRYQATRIRNRAI